MSENHLSIQLVKDRDKYNIIYGESIILEKLDMKDLIFIFDRNNRTAAYVKLQGAVSIINEDADLGVIISSLKAQYRELIPKIKQEEKEDEILPIVESWEDFETKLNELIRGRSEDFKFVLSVIVSYWFIHADDDFCNYFLILAPKGKGKSALLTSFSKCNDFVECVDNMTMEAWAPGSVDGKKVIGIADMVQDKTLMIHDVTSLFGNKEEKLKKILWDFEQSFGMEPFRKGMPGAIQPFGGGWNGIFGIPPMLFRNNRLSFLHTSRFFVYQLTPINERNIILSDNNRPKKSEIRKICSAFINHLNKSVVDIKIPESVKRYMIDFLEVYVEYLKVYKGEYHNWESEGIIRRYNQVESLIKARCIVSGIHEPTIEDAKYWLKMLWFGESNIEVLDKLRMTRLDPDEYEEFFI